MFPNNATYGQVYGPAMTIQTKEEAQAYLKELVEWSLEQKHKPTAAEAEKMHKEGLGYWAGYYNHETRERVERLFDCVHPIFGAIATSGPPTAEEALEAGLKMGRKVRDAM